MKRFHKLSLVAVLSAVLLFVPLRGGGGLRAQGIPTIDLSNLATAIMNWLQDQDVAGLFETVSGKAITVEEWAEKVSQITSYIAYAKEAFEMYESGRDIYNMMSEMIQQVTFMYNAGQYFMKINAPETIIFTAGIISAQFYNLITDLVSEIQKSITKYMNMGFGNVMTAMKMTEEIVSDVRDTMVLASQYYRNRLSELFAYTQSINRAIANSEFLHLLFY